MIANRTFGICDSLEVNMTTLDEDFIEELRRSQHKPFDFSTNEKLIFAVEWVVYQTMGNGLLFGLIQFDRLGGDPLKRRITDQVSWILASTICSSLGELKVILSDSDVTSIDVHF